ncbi:co-chaperone GroES [Arcobacter sp. 15-2]|uniref:co-chaperone GroES n=1 Tax=Arcobacter sp. 15-2 TaxID=3374109 RepID=UPI00399C702D
MNFQPLGDRVLLKVQEVETKTASGIIIPDNASQEKPTVAEVVAIGSEVKEVAVGDTIIYTKFARSATVTIDTIEYLVMETSEILGKFEETK